MKYAPAKKERKREREKERKGEIYIYIYIYGEMVRDGENINSRVFLLMFFLCVFFLNSLHELQSCEIKMRFEKKSVEKKEKEKEKEKEKNDDNDGDNNNNNSNRQFFLLLLLKCSLHMLSFCAMFNTYYY